MDCDQRWESVVAALGELNDEQAKSIETLVADLSRAQDTCTAQEAMWRALYNTLKVRFESLQSNVKRLRKASENGNGINLNSFYQDNDPDLTFEVTEPPTDVKLMRHHVPQTDGKGCSADGMVPCRALTFSAHSSSQTPA